MGGGTTPVLPTIITTAASSVNISGATSGGNISNDGGAPVTARGVCWSKIPNPDVTGNHTTDGKGTGTFVSTITDLTSSTTYYLRAYATNSAGTAYGNELNFTTTSAGTLPTVITAAINSITSATATSGGNVSADGGATVTARGICWSTSPAPDISGTHTTDGSGLGSFISNMSGLTSITTFYVRAYATNSVGTAYGNEINFTTISADVYIAGFENNGTMDVATLWKNGVAMKLTSGSNTGRAFSAYVDGTDVYVAGVESSTTSGQVAKVWKNGIPTTLTNGDNHNADAWALYVADHDVYVAGDEETSNDILVAKIWKNGVATSLSNGVNQAEAWSVYVSGTDVYAAGYEVIGGASVARLWKNGIATSLTSGIDGGATWVFVSDGDVYVTGYESNGTKTIAKVWKNGVATDLTNGVNNAIAYAVYVVGSDVYVSGSESNGTKTVAKIWKNGVATSLTDGTNSARAYSVFVSGGDVYAAGYDNGAKFWKNGIATTLANNGFAGGVFVK